MRRSGSHGVGLAVLMSAFLGLVGLVSAASAAEPDSAVVRSLGPGETNDLPVVATACPTFHWGVSGSDAPAAIELRVASLTETGEEVQARPVLERTFPGEARVWTPYLDECLEQGGLYAWWVRPLGPSHEPGSWSEARYLQVGDPGQATAPGSGSAADGVIDTSPGVSSRSPAGERRRPKARRSPVAIGGAASVAGAIVAISGRRSETSGNAIGVVGETASPDGAGVAAANADPGGGPDLLLDGAAQGIPDTVLTESGLDRASGGDEVFEFGNSGAGSLSLRLDGADLVTTLTDEDTLGGLSCTSGELPKSDGAGGWSCAADADTSYSAGNQLTLSGSNFAVVEGSGSDLDADLLDGLDSTEVIAQASDETRNEIDSVPFVIDQPGSYYMSRNLTMSTAGDGITVNTGDVIVDLGGFVLDGGGVADDGVVINGMNVEVANGTVRNFTGHGIEVEFTTNGARILGVGIQGNGNKGIWASGDGHLITGCSVLNNGHDGISVGSGMIVNNAVVGNANYGIFLVHGGAAHRNDVRENGSHGFRVQSGPATLASNTIALNGGRGILAGNAVVVEANSVKSNTAEGIVAFTGATVRGNAVQNSGLSGIRARAAVVVDNALYNNNTSDNTNEAGIVLSGNARVLGNTVVKSGNANILVTFDGNTIEGNLLVDAFDGTGLSIEDTGNFYAGNRASQNGMDYMIVTGNTNGGGNVSF